MYSQTYRLCDTSSTTIDADDASLLRQEGGHTPREARPPTSMCSLWSGYPCTKHEPTPLECSSRDAFIDDPLLHLLYHGSYHTHSTCERGRAADLSACEGRRQSDLLSDPCTSVAVEPGSTSPEPTEYFSKGLGSGPSCSDSCENKSNVEYITGLICKRVHISLHLSGYMHPWGTAAMAWTMCQAKNKYESDGIGSSLGQWRSPVGARILPGNCPLEGPLYKPH